MRQPPVTEARDAAPRESLLHPARDGAALRSSPSGDRDRQEPQVGKDGTGPLCRTWQPFSTVRVFPKLGAATFADRTNLAKGLALAVFALVGY